MVFISLFIVLKWPSEILVLLTNPGNGIFIYFISNFLNFHDFLTLFPLIIHILGVHQNRGFCLLLIRWLNATRISLSKCLEMLIDPYYVP